MIESIHELIVVLMAIQAFAKDIHYSVTGEASYSKHLLADRIQDGIYDYIDSLKETCILAQFKETLPSKEYFRRTIQVIPDKKDDDMENFKELATLLKYGREVCNEICSDGAVEAGVANLAGGIAEFLMNQSGVLYLQTKPFIPEGRMEDTVGEKLEVLKDKFQKIKESV